MVSLQVMAHKYKIVIIKFILLCETNELNILDWHRWITLSNYNSCLVLISLFSPFDVEDLTLSSGNISKATALQRRVSVYSQGTPETPTFQDTSFFVSQTRIQTSLLASCWWWEAVVLVVVHILMSLQTNLSYVDIVLYGKCWLWTIIFLLTHQAYVSNVSPTPN